MTDEEIRKAACEAWDYERGHIGTFAEATVDMSESTICAMAAVYRAGMEAGRAEAAVKPKRQKAPACSVLRPLTVDEQTWADWLTLRKAKKAAVTQTVLNSACREATKAGMTLEAFLRVWCYRGSQGLEADWLKPHERQGQAPQETQYEAAARRRAEQFAPHSAVKAPGARPQQEFIDVDAKRLD